MLNKTRFATSPRLAAMAVLAAGLLLIAGSALWLAMTGDTGIRYSADTDDTIPMWFTWIPALLGLALVRLVPPSPTAPTPAPGRPRLEAGVLLAAAVLFAVTLRLAGGGEPAHTLLKLLLLLGVPAGMFWTVRHRRPAWLPADAAPDVRRRWAPAVPVAAWIVLSYASPWARPSSDYASTVDVLTLVLTLVVVFFVNSLLEEVFYRRWLQSRWEAILGRWPAIVLTSLLWAAWHVGLQGSGDLQADLASAFVNQGVLGLFLGYLWSRYRVMWPIITVHGAVNAVPILLPLL